MKKRTTWNFEGYTHSVEIFKSDDGNEIRVDHLRKGNSSSGYIKFMNHNYGLSVFGDFGNWIFYRPFIPSSKGFVSEGYWLEKLKFGSSQTHSSYDPEETEKELDEWIDNRLEDYGFEGDELKRYINFFTSLKSYVDEETTYKYHAFWGSNYDIDYELIPFCKKTDYQLLIIFDAFEFMCNCIKQSNGERASLL